MLLIGTTHGLVDLDGDRTLLEGGPVTGLAASPAGCHVLVDRQTVIRLDAAGPSVIGTLPAPDGQSLAVLEDGTVIVGRRGAHLSILGPDIRDLAGFERVTGRDGWQNPAGPVPDTRSLAVGADRLWVNVHVGGLWCSDDYGVTWHSAIEPDADIHEVRTGLDGHVVVAAARGFGWSPDKGRSWSWSTAGPHARYLRACGLDGDTAFVTASDGPFTSRAGVYRARLGEPFVRCEEGLPTWFSGNIDTGRLDAADGRAAFGFENQLYLSEDQGRSWPNVHQLPDAITAVRFHTTGC